MTDTVVTLVGNVATGVEFKESPTGGVARFRFAVPVRRWDRAAADWTDGPTSFYTVWAWRALAANLAASVSVGEPLVVQGRLRVREEEREGKRRTFVDIEASSAGHDLSRGTSAFRRVARVPGNRGALSQGEVVAGLLAKAGADHRPARERAPAGGQGQLWESGPPERPGGRDRVPAPAASGTGGGHEGTGTRAPRTDEQP
ncbi:single-stranded DNA-binding protein [Streptomyces bomunensis]|uniref:Single-stranded DNA-binding protein n=1 Tax=Streptomyces montanisoli TaxID=2798581 RepID=A0A940MK31_9ACTN|nr:single-stranded DNA-binding protein [Streptomyces montanisoli]MBP0461570.1 single-stranded DNA-binding protein [Streptomyces montanisoli]